VSHALRFQPYGGISPNSAVSPNLKQRIANGYEYLAQIVNDDGGVPASAESDISGVWTTAEALDTIVRLPCIPHERFRLASQMWTFLLGSQLGDSSNSPGAWPVLKSGTSGSGLATGHAVSAIRRAHQYFGSDCPDELVNAAQKGLDWLAHFQAHDGGWGVEPATPPHGSQPRMISTVYAVEAFTSSGFSVETSQNLRKARQWILNMRAPDGGFRSAENYDTDPCNTARAIRALIEMRAISPADKIVPEAIAYLKKTKPKGRPWPSKIESFIVEASSGEIVFNDNTPSDALLMLVMADPNNPMVFELIQWFVLSQQSNGSWSLTPDDLSRAHICTWSTSEALIALGEYEWATIDPSIMLAERGRWSRRLMVGVTLALGVETLLLLNVNRAAVRAWDDIPKVIQSIILVSVIVAILVNLGSDLIYDAFKNKLRHRV
jgi:Prenyltransferase and squalene oxidase repeat